jgi:hypothetical protein
MQSRDKSSTDENVRQSFFHKNSLQLLDYDHTLLWGKRR